MTVRESRARARRASALVWALLLPPLLSGCAVFGYPAPTPRPPSLHGPLGAGPEAPVEEEDPAPPVAPTPAPAPATAGSYVVFGRRYHLLASADGYHEVGVASWYGDEFAGRPTASGEIYDPRGLTAAHRTLPLETRVEVVNLDNGRRIVLRINDRGPFADPNRRIIDVSYGAARQLGLLVPGLARVEVRALSAEDR